MFNISSSGRYDWSTTLNQVMSPTRGWSGREVFCESHYKTSSLSYSRGLDTKRQTFERRTFQRYGKSRSQRKWSSHYTRVAISHFNLLLLTRILNGENKVTQILTFDTNFSLLHPTFCHYRHRSRWWLCFNTYNEQSIKPEFYYNFFF